MFVSFLSFPPCHSQSLALRSRQVSSLPSLPPFIVVHLSSATERRCSKEEFPPRCLFSFSCVCACNFSFLVTHLSYSLHLFVVVGFFCSFPRSRCCFQGKGSRSRAFFFCFLFLFFLYNRKLIPERFPPLGCETVEICEVMGNSILLGHGLGT